MRQIDPAIRDLFKSFPEKFPELRMHFIPDHYAVELMIEIPQQPGLEFEVCLYVDGDELHITAASFWCEWFPDSDEGVRADYREAVEGLLSGEFRILEHFVADRAVKAQLQKPAGEGWRNVATRANLLSFLPWPRRQRVRKVGAASATV